MSSSVSILKRVVRCFWLSWFSSKIRSHVLKTSTATKRTLRSTSTQKRTRKKPKANKKSKRKSLPLLRWSLSYRLWPHSQEKKELTSILHLKESYYNTMQTNLKKNPRRKLHQQNWMHKVSLRICHSQTSRFRLIKRREQNKWKI